MKKTLRIFTLMLMGVIGVALWSCSDDDNDQPIVYDSLPALAKAFVTLHYSDTSVSSVVQKTDNGLVEYEVLMADGQKVTFNASGEWIDVDAPAGQTIPLGIVPAKITVYIASNYSGVGVSEISKSVTGYEVELVSGVDLLFDAAGDFVRVE